MQKNILSRQRHHERGQTIILVAISLVSLLAMAALAIDIVTLIFSPQRDSASRRCRRPGRRKSNRRFRYHTLSTTDPNFTTVQTWAQTIGDEPSQRQ